MEIISAMSEKKRWPQSIKISPYLRDHHFEGKVILPAVETLIVLVSSVAENYSDVGFNCFYNARFPRFLIIPEKSTSMDVSIEIERDEEKIIARLLTVMSTKAGINRTIEHASVEIPVKSGEMMPNSGYREKLGGDCINIPAATIYRDLVNFGEAYRNITGDLSISPEGVFCCISGGNSNAASDILGSPFVFDAAMHAACIWGQRYHDIVAFPVGFAKREIYRKTKKDGFYLSRIWPETVNSDELTFDVQIWEESGALCEIIKGLTMRDVSSGRLQPPQWIKIVGN